MSVALLREGGKYYRECRLFKCFRDVSEMSIFGCHKTLTPPPLPPIISHTFRLTIVDFIKEFYK